MAAEGVQSPFEISQLSVLGLVEGLMAYPRVVRLANRTAVLAKREQPDVVILIDSWGFNLRVATRIRKAVPGALLVKYVAPQVWASRAGRARTLARSVDHLLSINSLDFDHFQAVDLPTTFVGAPALAREPVDPDRARLRERIGAGTDEPILLIAPGSRPAEIKRLGHVFADAAHRLKVSHPNLRVIVTVASTVSDAIRGWSASLPTDTFLIEDEQGKQDAMAAATVALACSGTVTTELALAGCPMVVGYRLGAITYAILSRLLTAKYITLFNVTAGEMIAPELVQEDCTGPNLAQELARRLDDPELRASQIARQNAALERMGRGGPDPSDLAADAVLGLLEHRRLVHT